MMGEFIMALMKFTNHAIQKENAGNDPGALSKKGTVLLCCVKQMKRL